MQESISYNSKVPLSIKSQTIIGFYIVTLSIKSQTIIGFYIQFMKSCSFRCNEVASGSTCYIPLETPDLVLRYGEWIKY